MFDQIIEFIRSLYQTRDNIPLHAPVFFGNEKKYLQECIDSTFVSSVGTFVTEFENKIADYTHSKYTVAAVNGTSALHLALLMAGVKPGEEIITQALTFVATPNAILYCQAKPVYIDVDFETMGMSPEALKKFLTSHARVKNGICYNINSGGIIRACLPVHTFGHPCRITEIREICEEFSLTLIEDAAEALGSFYEEKHCGTFGTLGILSFNGNKTITTGGGGMILTNNEEIARKARHLSTTAKLPHKWSYVHDEIGFNYRLTNISAALGCAQMEKIHEIIRLKRKLAGRYQSFFEGIKDVKFMCEPTNSTSNYWLNTILFNTKKQRDAFLDVTHKNGILTRPPWTLMNNLKPFKSFEVFEIQTSELLANQLVNLPSSIIN